MFPRRVLSPALRLTGARMIGEGMAQLRYAIRYGPA